MLITYIIGSVQLPKLLVIIVMVIMVVIIMVIVVVIRMEMVYPKIVP